MSSRKSRRSNGNDTVYAIALLDLSGGPLLLHVPDTDGRYYVLQFVDAWTNNFAYVGRRATGTAEGTYLIAPPRWAGEAPGIAHSVVMLLASGATVALGRHDRHALVTTIGVLGMLGGVFGLLFDLGIGLMASAGVFAGCAVVALLVAFALRRGKAA